MQGMSATAQLGVILTVIYDTARNLPALPAVKEQLPSVPAFATCDAEEDAISCAGDARQAILPWASVIHTSRRRIPRACLCGSTPLRPKSTRSIRMARAKCGILCRPPVRPPPEPPSPYFSPLCCIRCFLSCADLPAPGALLREMMHMASSRARVWRLRLALRSNVGAKCPTSLGYNTDASCQHPDRQRHLIGRQVGSSIFNRQGGLSAKGLVALESAVAKPPYAAER